MQGTGTLVNKFPLEYVHGCAVFKLQWPRLQVVSKAIGVLVVVLVVHGLVTVILC